MKIDGSLQGLNYKWRANLNFHDIFRFLIETIYSFKFSKIKLSLQKLYPAKTINLSYLYRVKYLLNNLSNELRIFPKTDRHSPPDKTGIKITFTLPTVTFVCRPGPLPRFNGSPWIYSMAFR